MASLVQLIGISLPFFPNMLGRVSRHGVGSRENDGNVLASTLTAHKFRHEVGLCSALLRAEAFDQLGNVQIGVPRAGKAEGVQA